MIYECEKHLDQAIEKEVVILDQGKIEEAKTVKRVSKVVDHLKMFKAVEKLQRDLEFKYGNSHLTQI